jgi:hypothetical protein
MGMLAAYWLNILSDAQRAAWATYADQVLMVNRLGEQKKLPPMTHFTRSNVPRLQAGLSQVDDAPTIFNLGEFLPPTCIADVSAHTLSIDFNSTDEWCGEDGGALLALVSPGLNPTIDFYKGPYNYAGKIAGAVVPPTPPKTVPLPFVITVDQRVYCQLRVTRADGRLSLPYSFRPSVQA